MQRYHAGSCTSAVNNSAIGGPSTRDIGRTDSSFLPTNFPVSSRVRFYVCQYFFTENVITYSFFSYVVIVVHVIKVLHIPNKCRCDKTSGALVPLSQ